MRVFVAAVVGVFLIGCPQPIDNTAIDAGGTGGGGVGGTGGGGGSGGTGGGSGGAGGGNCTEDWQCSGWQPTWGAQPPDGGAPSGGTATRTCVDQNSCGTTANKPAETTALPNLDLNFYKCQVQPIEAKSCGMIGCHGQKTPARPLRVFSRGRLRDDSYVVCIPAMCLQPARCGINLGTVGYANVECAANLPLTPSEWQKNYDWSRTFAIGISNPDQSELLAQPVEGSTFAHAQVKLFKATDPDYATIRRWLDGGTQATCNTGPN